MYASTQYHQGDCPSQVVAALDLYNTTFQSSVRPGSLAPLQMDLPQQVVLSGAPPLHAPIPMSGQTPSLLEYGTLHNSVDYRLPSVGGYHSNGFNQSQVQRQQHQQHHHLQALPLHEFSGSTAEMTGTNGYDGCDVDAPIHAHTVSSEPTPTHPAHAQNQAPPHPPPSSSSSSTAKFSFGPPDHNDFPVQSQPQSPYVMQQQIGSIPVQQAHIHYTSVGALHPQVERYPEVVSPLDLPPVHFVQPEQQQEYYNHGQQLQHQISAVRHQQQSPPPVQQLYHGTTTVQYTRAPGKYPPQQLQHPQYQPQGPVRHTFSRVPPHNIVVHEHGQHQHYQRQQGAASHPYKRLPASILMRNNVGTANTNIANSGLNAPPINPPPPPMAAQYHRQPQLQRSLSDLQVMGAPQAVYEYPGHSPPPSAQQHQAQLPVRQQHQQQLQPQQHQQRLQNHQNEQQLPQHHRLPQPYDPPPPYVPDEPIPHPHPHPPPHRDLVSVGNAPPPNRFLTPSELLIEMADKGLAGAGGAMSGAGMGMSGEDSGNLSAESSFSSIDSGGRGGGIGMGGGSLSGGGGMNGGVLRGDGTGGLGCLGDMFTTGESASKARRKAMAKRIGFMPTDPDGLSSHEKKRYYLECLEYYTLFLREQVEFLPPDRRIDPVPLECVQSYPGLNSRSIRTMLVHMEKRCRDMHEETMREEQRFVKLREAFSKKFGVYGRAHA